jgi:pimeloyl-ACP methyl ester carboxylesterase
VSDEDSATRTVQSRGHDIAYTAAGSGPVVVLLPGMFMGRVRWIETGYLNALADDYRLLAIDPLGFGDSDKPHDPAQYHAAGLAADTLAVLDAEGVDQAHLWGYSRGTGLAADLACLHPQRCRSLVVGGSPILIPRSALPPNPDMVDALRAGDWERTWEAFGSDLPAEVTALMQQRNDPVACAAAYQGLVEDVDRSTLACPVLFYVGGGEWFWEVVRDEADSTGARLEVIGDLDHAATFQASDTVIPLVNDFLRSI